MIRFFVYLIFTFAGLFLGGLFTNPGVMSEWYEALSKAPWTPPGWVFGLAWTIIGVTCSAWAMKVCHKSNEYLMRYWIIWIFNFAWNPIFFAAHNTTMAAVVISILLLLVVEAMVKTHREYGPEVSAWLLPYAIWLSIANSLNWYIILEN